MQSQPRATELARALNPNITRIDTSPFRRKVLLEQLKRIANTTISRRDLDPIANRFAQAAKVRYNTLTRTLLRSIRFDQFPIHVLLTRLLTSTTPQVHGVIISAIKQASGLHYIAFSKSQATKTPYQACKVT